MRGKNMQRKAVFILGLLILPLLLQSCKTVPINPADDQAREWLFPEIAKIDRSVTMRVGALQDSIAESIFKYVIKMSRSCVQAPYLLLKL